MKGYSFCFDGKVGKSAGRSADGAASTAAAGASASVAAGSVAANEAGAVFARARVEDANVSYKELSEVCARIRGKGSEWALSFLDSVAAGEAAVLFKRHNKNMGHRRELGGRPGRYPWKAAKVVLGALQSALANGKARGLGEPYSIVSATANMKNTYPRTASKGRWARSNLQTSRVEIVLKGNADAGGHGLPKTVSVKAPSVPAAHTAHTAASAPTPAVHAHAHATSAATNATIAHGAKHEVKAEAKANGKNGKHEGKTEVKVEAKSEPKPEPRPEARNGDNDTHGKNEKKR